MPTTSENQGEPRLKVKGETTQIPDTYRTIPQGGKAMTLQQIVRREADQIISEHPGRVAVGVYNDKPSVEMLLSALLAGKSKQTIRAYRSDLEDFQTFLGADDMADVARIFLSDHGRANAIALQYQQDLIDRGLQSTTVNRKLAALRSLTQVARTLGMISWRLEIRNQKTEAYRDTSGPGIANFRKMLALVAGKNDAKSIRAVAILRLLFDLGLRRGEVASLTITDVDLDRKTIMVMGKGRTQKTSMTLPDVTIETLRVWIAIRGTEDGPLFVNFDRAGKGGGLSDKGIYRIVKGLGEQIGIDTRPHGIRHTAITQAVKMAQSADIDLEEVCDFSRHADIRTLMIYRDRERNVQGKLSSLISQAV